MSSKRICVFCAKQLNEYDSISAEFNTMFESDEIIDGKVYRAPIKRIGCTYPIYACHICVVKESGILNEVRQSGTDDRSGYL